MKNIENFVTEEHKKAPRSMQLAWVAEVSEISMSQEVFDTSEIRRVSGLLKERPSGKSVKDGSIQASDFSAAAEEPSAYNASNALNQQAANELIKIEEYQDVQYVTTEVQTDMNFQEKVAPATKVYKEVNIQTDPVRVGPPGSGDEGSERAADHKSATTTERRAKQLNTFSADLQQNMNELLTE